MNTLKHLNFKPSTLNGRLLLTNITTPLSTRHHFSPPGLAGESEFPAAGDTALFAAREQALISLLQPCSTMRHLSQTHTLIIKLGFARHVFVAGRLISFCAVSELGSMEHAAAVFADLDFPDAFSYNTMIRGFVRTNNDEQALHYFKMMRKKSKPADNFTFSFLLKLCAKSSMAELGFQLHCDIVKGGYDLHNFVRNTLIHMYAMFGDIEVARKLFDEMPLKDLVSWNVFIGGLVHCAWYKEALKAFDEMQGFGFSPDAATFVVVLSACAELGELDFGRRVHSRIGIVDDVVSVSNSLIDMYSKCGAVDAAVSVFHEMKGRNTVSWNSMIMGLAMHGRALEALQLFDEMLLADIDEPNDITFLGVLCACSHGGLVEEGRRYLRIMKTDYGIDPSVHHHGCLVDLLGRKGMLMEAYELVRSMAGGGNAVVWRTLLGACRVHGDLEMGERVRRHLTELEPDHSSDFVLLSHMYAMEGRWGDVMGVRKDMLGMRAVKPEPGKARSK